MPISGATFLQFKLFRGLDPEKLETAVNTWLASIEGKLTIHNTNTAMTTAESDDGRRIPAFSISVWYELA